MTTGSEYFVLDEGEVQKKYLLKTDNGLATFSNQKDLKEVQSELASYLGLQFFDDDIKLAEYMHGTTLKLSEDLGAQKYCDLVLDVFGFQDSYVLRRNSDSNWVLNHIKDYALQNSSLQIFNDNQSLKKEEWDAYKTRTLQKMSEKKAIQNAKPYDIYFAGGLFTSQELLGNMYLSEAINHKSKGKYNFILPQDLQQMATTPKEIRDNDLLAVKETDGIIVNFDGNDLDSGTVVEFMAAKFLNKPTVIYRTDVRKGGDAGMKDGNNEDSKKQWSYMLQNYPRTAHTSRMGNIYDEYQTAKDLFDKDSRYYCHFVSTHLCRMVSEEIVSKLDEVFEGYVRTENKVKNPVTDLTNNQLFHMVSDIPLPERPVKMGS